MKSKFIILVLGLSLALAGCASSGSQKSSSTAAKHQQSSGHVQNSNSGAPDLNGGSEQSSGTTTKTTDGSNQTTETTQNSPVPNSSTPDPSHPAPQQAIVNMSTVTAVRLADFNTGWAGGNGWVAKTVDAGKSWTVVYQGNGTVQQIFALNPSDVWITLNPDGNAAKLLHSSDGGRNWILVGATPNQAFLHFISKTTALSGNYLSKDGGKTWQQLPIPNNTVGDAYFHDEQNGWVVTQSANAFYVNRTTDGGKSWETVMTKSIQSPLNGAIIRSAGTNDAWVELIGDSGMSQTSYSVFHTTDGGTAWKAVIANSTAGGGPAPGFNQDVNNNGHNNKGSKPGPLYVVNPKVAFMGGLCPACDDQNSIGWTKDGGSTWINSNVTLNGNGDTFLTFADAYHGWWITVQDDHSSKMYITSDGGYHWKQVYNFH